MAKNLDEAPTDPLSEVSYRAFLLRCWQEEGSDLSGEPSWRFALVKLGGKHCRRGFSCLEDMTAYLEEELQAAGKS